MGEENGSRGEGCGRKGIQGWGLGRRDRPGVRVVGGEVVQGWRLGEVRWSRGKGCGGEVVQG